MIKEKPKEHHINYWICINDKFGEFKGVLHSDEFLCPNNLDYKDRNEIHFKAIQNLKQKLKLMHKKGLYEYGVYVNQGYAK
jgi:hypothetical protein